MTAVDLSAHHGYAGSERGDQGHGAPIARGLKIWIAAGYVIPYQADRQKVDDEDDEQCRHAQHAHILKARYRAHSAPSGLPSFNSRTTQPRKVPFPPKFRAS